MISSTRSRIIIAEQSGVEWIRLPSRALGLHAWHMIALLVKCLPLEAALIDPSPWQEKHSL
jgi:hypothetical protein